MLPLNPLLLFDAASHTYTLAGAPLVSVSAWGKQWAAPVDLTALAGKLVERGQYAAALYALAPWDWERCRGTLVHAALEGEGWELATGAFLEPVPLTDTARLMADAGYVWLSKLLHAGWIIDGIEYRVGCRVLGIGGTIDLILRGPDGQRLVVDWKTCRRLWVSAFADEETGEVPHLRGPFRAYEDCKLTRYAVSLGAYRLLLHRNGTPTDGAVLVHLTPTGVVVYATPGSGLPGRPRKLPDMLPLLTTHFTPSLSPAHA